jgi:hypothetical protein
MKSSDLTKAIGIPDALKHSILQERLIEPGDILHFWFPLWDATISQNGTFRLTGG